MLLKVLEYKYEGYNPSILLPAYR